MLPTHYRPSGRFSPLALALVPLAVALSVPLAWLYAWCAIHLRGFVMPFVAVGYFLLLLAACTAVGQAGKVRSPALLTVLTGVIGLAGWYLQWAQWAIMAGEASGARWPGLAEVVLHPSAILASVLAFKGVSAWAVCSVTIELLVLAVMPALIAASAAARPFCETSKTWVTELKLGRRFGAVAPSGVTQFVAALEAQPDEIMAMLDEPHGNPDHYTTLSIHACEGAPEAYLSVWDVTRSVKDGKQSEARVNLVQYLRIAPQTARALVAQCDEQALHESHGDAPQELKAALDALHGEDFAAARSAALPFCGAPDAALRNDANRVCALSCSRLGHWAAAAGHWEALFEHEASSHNAMQVASSSVMAGDLAKGEQWFEKALAVNETTRDTAQIHSYTNFISALQMSGNVRAALPYLEWVRQVYQGLNITDSTFLTLRGVPFFISFLEKSAPTVEASMDAGQAHAWYASMLPYIDQNGRDTLNAWLAERAYG